MMSVVCGVVFLFPCQKSNTFHLNSQTHDSVGASNCTPYISRWSASLMMASSSAANLDRLWSAGRFDQFTGVMIGDLPYLDLSPQKLCQRYTINVVDDSVVAIRSSNLRRFSCFCMSELSLAITKKTLANVQLLLRLHPYLRSVTEFGNDQSQNLRIRVFDRGSQLLSTTYWINEVTNE